MCAVLLSVLPVPIAAHTSGASYETVVDEKLIDIGYSEEEIVVGEAVVFDFGIFDAVTNEAVPYTDVWMRIEQERNVFFASGIHRPSIGATTMVYQFLEPGTYTVAVRFQNDTEEVVATEFVLTVQNEVGAAVTNMVPIAAGSLAAFIVGAVGGYWLQSRRRASLIQLDQ